VPLLLYEGEEEIAQHPFLDLVARPNGTQTSADFFESWYGFLLVAGNAYCEAVAVGGALRELHALRPDRMKVIPGLDGWPEAYEYAVNGRSVRFEEEPVTGVRPILHVRMFHPTNDHYGLSPIEAAATAIDIHNEASRWNKALLDNAARPSGALIYGAGGSLTGEQFERLKGELEASFQGASNAGRPLLLEGGLDWKPLSLSPKDMDFIEAKNSAAREIALALGVPPMLLGIPGDNTYSNYQEAQRSFWRQTVLPLVNRTAKAFSAWLSPAWGGNLDLRTDLDAIEALSPERDALWTRLEKASFLSRDEKRAAVGYGAGDGSDAGLAQKYSPDQPRAPAGGSDGGQWVAEGGGGSGGSGTDDGRVISDANPDDAWKPGAQYAQPAGRTGYPVDLLEEQALGGHTWQRHIAKPEEYLKARITGSRVNIPLIGGVGEKRAGSFTSLEAANKLVNATISRPENQVRLEALLRGGVANALPFTYLDADFPTPTGYEAFSPRPGVQPAIRTAYGVKVRVWRTNRTPRGWYVDSAWPLNRD
jgi:HK97 family phage portal protein